MAKYLEQYIRLHTDKFEVIETIWNTIYVTQEVSHFSWILFLVLLILMVLPWIMYLIITLLMKPKKIKGFIVLDNEWKIKRVKKIYWFPKYKYHKFLKENIS